MTIYFYNIGNFRKVSKPSKKRRILIFKRKSCFSFLKTGFPKIKSTLRFRFAHLKVRSNQAHPTMLDFSYKKSKRDRTAMSYKDIAVRRFLWNLRVPRAKLDESIKWIRC